jgi:hypothetical protein
LLLASSASYGSIFPAHCNWVLLLQLHYMPTSTESEMEYTGLGCGGRTTRRRTKLAAPAGDASWARHVALGIWQTADTSSSAHAMAWLKPPSESPVPVGQAIWSGLAW